MVRKLGGEGARPIQRYVSIAMQGEDFYEVFTRYDGKGGRALPEKLW
jgi:hypothetical protein